MSPLRWSGPFDEPDEEELALAREEMEELLEEAERDPFVALDRELEDSIVYDEYEEEIKDARLMAYGMMDDLDRWEAEDAAADQAEAGGDVGGDAEGGWWD